MQHYSADVKRKDGSDNEPDSLHTMHEALERHFRSAGYKFRIIKDKEFAECRQVLNGYQTPTRQPLIVVVCLIKQALLSHLSPIFLRSPEFHSLLLLEPSDTFYNKIAILIHQESTAPAALTTTWTLSTSGGRGRCKRNSAI